MSTLPEIEAAVKILPIGEKKALLQFLAAHLESTGDDSATANTQRIPGLHPGAWKVAPDFDAPLPDEFWLGQDA
ncbi:MAG: hypothetical protein M3Q89_05445 [Verrucomicrobiota bacterium]|nr:hypothetical protein [Verrucomicrobiota bacterium]